MIKGGPLEVGGGSEIHPPPPQKKEKIIQGKIFRAKKIESDHALITPLVQWLTHKCFNQWLKHALHDKLVGAVDKQDKGLLSIKPRANGRNIVGQQLPTLLDVTCSIRLQTLLHVVGCCCLLLHKVWNRSNFSANNSQHFFCSMIAEALRNNVGSVCTALPTLLGPRTLITHGLQRLMGCILPTMHCRSQHCWELLHLFAHHCKHAQQCWELLRPFARSLRRMFIIFSVFFLNTSTKGWTLFFWISTVITMHLSTLGVTANKNRTFVHVWRSSLT